VLWPKGAPGEKGDIGEEHDTTKPTEGLVASKRVIRLGNVSNPTIAIYRPRRGQRYRRGGSLSVSGGAYRILAMDLEGTEVCEWLNSIGVTGVLLKYRVPGRAGLEKHAAALQDAPTRPLVTCASHAAEWNLATQPHGHSGFFRGRTSISRPPARAFEQRAYEGNRCSRRRELPAGFSLCSFIRRIWPSRNRGEKIAPELTINEENAAHLSRPNRGRTACGWKIVCSITFALKNAHVPAEMHLYADGGHGYGLRHSEHAVSNWPARAEEWLRWSRGILGTQKK